MNYKRFGIMLDCSRNGVMKVSELKKFIDLMVKMGYNMLEIYAEDVFQLENEPYFGYLRGAYTDKELQEIDAYAISKGVELIPCVQTLAHFTSLVKTPHYYPIVDTADILLIDDDRTYELIEKIIASCARNFTSRSINIGMDEAHMVGLGRYLDRHGYTDRFKLLNHHLEKVVAILNKYGFKPHMWSDMYFRLTNNGVYRGKNPVAKEVMDGVPEGVGLVYWDYYSSDVKEYDRMFDFHNAFKKEVWFAGGAWTWFGFAPFNYYSLKTMKPAMESVRRYNIENVMITLWGDDGKECSYYAVLPSLYAIRQYADGNFDEEKIAKGFEELFGYSYSDFMKLDAPNYTKRVLEEGALENPCRTFFYGDCLMGLFDDYAEKERIDYMKYANELFEAKNRAGEFGYIFQAMATLCQVLSCKSWLGVDSRKAYRANDKETLKELIEKYELTEKYLMDFYAAHKEVWFRENKAIGWEVQDARLGGLAFRVKTCKERILQYLNGEIDKIEELEQDIINFEPNGNYAYTYQTVISMGNL